MVVKHYCADIGEEDAIAAVMESLRTFIPNLFRNRSRLPWMKVTGSGKARMVCDLCLSYAFAKLPAQLACGGRHHPLEMRI